MIKFSRTCQFVVIEMDQLMKIKVFDVYAGSYIENSFFPDQPIYWVDFYKGYSNHLILIKSNGEISFY
jgi:hypothetical protein